MRLIALFISTVTDPAYSIFLGENVLYVNSKITDYVDFFLRTKKYHFSNLPFAACKMSCQYVRNDSRLFFSSSWWFNCFIIKESKQNQQ